MEKFLNILELVEEEGAHAAPAMLPRTTAGGRSTHGMMPPQVVLCPLHSWYHSGFLTDDVLERAAAWERKVYAQYDKPFKVGPQPEPPPPSPSDEAGASSRRETSQGGGLLARRNLSAAELASLDDGGMPDIGDGAAAGSLGSSREGSSTELAREVTREYVWTDADVQRATELRRERREQRNKATVDTMDGACVWPRCFESEPDGGRTQRQLLCEFFGRLNDLVIDEMLKHPIPDGFPKPQIITYSHFVPHPKLHRGPRFMGDIEGSSYLSEHTARMRPMGQSVTHVFGHTHWDISTTIKGVRYVQKPLGYPKERALDGAAKRISIADSATADWAESPPLEMIWGLQI